MDMFFLSINNLPPAEVIFPLPDLIQSPNIWHRRSSNISDGKGSILSGLLHHMQLRGQPLKKIFVLTPSPSCIEYLCMLKTVSNWQGIVAVYIITLSRSLRIVCRCDARSFMRAESKTFLRLNRSVRIRSRKISW